jgi:periplasmic protein CpxP/Spy
MECTMLKQSRILAIAATALAMSFGAANIASAAASDAQPNGGPGMMGGSWGHHRMEMRMKEHLERLHAQLQLNADQEKLWQAALNTMKQNHEAMRKSHMQMREQMKTMLQQPILDLNAMHAARQNAQQQNAQLRDQTAAAWLNFYNSLNDQQKTTVSTELKKHFARMREHEMKKHEHWGHQHGGAGAPDGASGVNP